MKQVFEKLIEAAQDYQDDNQDRIMEKVGVKFMVGLYVAIVGAAIWVLCIA